MARQFIFKSNDITKIDKAYLYDALCLHTIDKDGKLQSNELYKLAGPELKHIHVLRYKIGDSIVVNNMECKLLHMSKEFIIVDKMSDMSEKGKPTVNVTLYQAFLKSDKMDYLVQKSVELGITNIVPFFSTNTIVKLDEKDRLKRQEKLQKICIEATKQCGRTDDVTINTFMNFKEMLQILSKHNFCIFAYENETTSIKSVIKKLQETNILYNDIAVIVGPEGGFDIKEVEQLNNISNVHTVSLGERILRAETACVNLITIMMYEFDNN